MEDAGGQAQRRQQEQCRPPGSHTGQGGGQRQGSQGRQAGAAPWPGPAEIGPDRRQPTGWRHGEGPRRARAAHREQTSGKEPGKTAHGETAKPKPSWKSRTSCHGDNPDLMRSMDSPPVELIATGPPFNNGRDLHASSVSLAAGGSSQDRWRWGKDVRPEWVEQMQGEWPGVRAVVVWTRMVHSDAMAAFLCFMAVGLVSKPRIPRGGGSPYLHCGSTARGVPQDADGCRVRRKAAQARGHLQPPGVLWRQEPGEEPAPRT